ncbi:hypothetical protein B566_EDAN002344 [Ephemera danica]|nr:hypothetical protein B566_EDAN002344 [Ephemera danica]
MCSSSSQLPTKSTIEPKMYTLVLVHLLVVTLIGTTVVAFPTGAPVSICETMTPIHGNAKPQTSVSPYLLKAVSNKTAILVTIFATGKDYFEGFMLQARNDDKKSIGTFTSSDPDVKMIDCMNGKMNTVTHSSPKKKMLVSANWIPPAQAPKMVTFTLTTVRSSQTFWVNQTLDCKL